MAYNTSAVCFCVFCLHWLIKANICCARTNSLENVYGCASFFVHSRAVLGKNHIIFYAKNFSRMCVWLQQHLKTSHNILMHKKLKHFLYIGCDSITKWVFTFPKAFSSTRQCCGLKITNEKRNENNLLCAEFSFTDYSSDNQTFSPERKKCI